MSTEPYDPLAPAADPDIDPTDRPYVEVLRPIEMWDKGGVEDDLFDFRPRPEEEVLDTVVGDDPDPKGSSVLASALAANFEMLRTPDSYPLPEETASVDKDSTPDKPSENGSMTSSSTPTPSSGKSEPPA